MIKNDTYDAFGRFVMPEVLAWIKNEVKPEDVFDTEQLKIWASRQNTGNIYQVDREKLIKAMNDNLRAIWHREYGDPVTNPDGIEIVGAEDAVDEILAMIGKEAQDAASR